MTSEDLCAGGSLALLDDALAGMHGTEFVAPIAGLLFVGLVAAWAIRRMAAAYRLAGTADRLSPEDWRVIALVALFTAVSAASSI